MTLALIDGDIVAYRAAVGVQKDYNWGNGVVSSDVDPKKAAEAALQSIEAWGRLARCSEVLVAFSGRNNFRYRILPTYKFNRTGKSKPLAYVYTVNAVTERFNTRTVDGLEADDVLGILATTDSYRDAVVVSIDKDLRTIPGRHFNPLSDKKPVQRSEYAADAQWLIQAITGDPTDGYTGVPGMGPIKAFKALGVPTARVQADAVRALAGLKLTSVELWPRVVSAYAASKLTEADALVQARVARILRREDYDRGPKEVILWGPKEPRERMKLIEGDQ